MRNVAAWGIGLAICFAALVAGAQTGENDEGEATRDAAPTPSPQDKNFSHALQFGLRASVLGGYRMLFRYDDSPFCVQPDPAEGGAKDQQKFCGHMGPAMLDVAVSFAPLGGVEPFVMGRFGFVGESQTNTQPLKLVGAGARLYTRKKQALKIFVEPSLGVEFEDGAGADEWSTDLNFDPQYKTDVIFRAAIGPQFDFARGVGAYAQVFGMSVGVLRYIHATLEFGAGIQARFP
jgi:hypothetical protein